MANENDNDAPIQADPARVEAFKKNLLYVYKESLALTGLPLDILMPQAFGAAAIQGLPAAGSMVNFGGGPSFLPNDDTLLDWLDAYFGIQAAKAQRAADAQPGADMAEA